MNPQVSEEKRLDVVITYLNEKFVVELKRWHGKQYPHQGLKQLSGYLDIQGLKQGFLVIFDHSEIKNWQPVWLEGEGKKVSAIWVWENYPGETSLSKPEFAELQNFLRDR